MPTENSEEPNYCYLIRRMEMRIVLVIMQISPAVRPTPIGEWPKKKKYFERIKPAAMAATNTKAFRNVILSISCKNASSHLSFYLPLTKIRGYSSCPPSNVYGSSPMPSPFRSFPL